MASSSKAAAHRADERYQHVVLLGLMASGKSTTGRLLANRLAIPMWDNDMVLEQLTEKTAAQIAETDGLAALHRKELAVLRMLVHRPTPSVVTAAASVADRPAMLARLLAPGSIRAVYLEVPPAVLAERARTSDDVHRPLASPDLPDLQSAARTRGPVYRSVADTVVDTHPLSPDAIVDRIIASLEGHQ